MKEILIFWAVASLASAGLHTRLNSRGNRALSGGNMSSGAEGCCRTLELVSNGLLPDSTQSHVLGRYNYHGEGREGTWTYRQTGGFEHYLYFMGPRFSQWMIGDRLFQNHQYAHGEGDLKCPEGIQSWKYYDSSTGQNRADPGARMVCNDDAVELEEDRCVTNEACRGCKQTIPLGGVTYCCNNFCDWASISVNMARNPPCVCHH